jgi:hypothetical protein
MDDGQVSCDSSQCVVEAMAHSDYSEARLPLACSCIEVNGCHPSCTMDAMPEVDFASGTLSVTQSVARATFVIIIAFILL